MFHCVVKDLVEISAMWPDSVDIAVRTEKQRQSHSSDHEHDKHRCLMSPIKQDKLQSGHVNKMTGYSQYNYRQYASLACSQYPCLTCTTVPHRNLGTRRVLGLITNFRKNTLIIFSNSLCITPQVLKFILRSIIT